MLFYVVKYLLLRSDGSH